MNRRLVLMVLALAAAFFVVGTGQPGAQGTTGPARAKLREACVRDPTSGLCTPGNDRIRSDGAGTYDSPPGGGTYADGWDCVRAGVGNGGGFGMRIDTYGCSPYTRSMNLDFSERVGGSLHNCPVYVPDPSDPSEPGLNICGSNSAQDMRVLASKLFKSNTTGVVMYFSLKPKFTGTSAFKLEFEQSVPISLDPTNPNVRIMEAGPDAVAELYQLSGTNLKISLGRYKMPFQMIVTLCGAIC